MNILDQANKIVNNRSEEKERMYGNFDNGMERAAEILTAMTGRPVDAVAYIGALTANVLRLGAVPHILNLIIKHCTISGIALNRC